MSSVLVHLHISLQTQQQDALEHSFKDERHFNIINIMLMDSLLTGQYVPLCVDSNGSSKVQEKLKESP